MNRNRERLEALQRCMHSGAQQVPLPSRFQATPQGSRVCIRDEATGREVTIGLCDYRGAREVLNTLFP